MVLLLLGHSLVPSFYINGRLFFLPTSCTENYNPNSCLVQMCEIVVKDESEQGNVLFACFMSVCEICVIAFSISSMSFAH